MVLPFFSRGPLKGATLEYYTLEQWERGTVYKAKKTIPKRWLIAFDLGRGRYCTTCMPTVFLR